MNIKPFQHKFTSEIECDEKDFPRQAFNALVNFEDLPQCRHLLWKMHKNAMCVDPGMEGEECRQLFEYYEIVHDVLAAVFMVHKNPLPS